MSNINVTGVGFDLNVEVQDGESLSEALARVGIDPDSSGSDVRVNGAEVEAAEVSPQAGDQVSVTPKQVALG